MQRHHAGQRPHERMRGILKRTKKKLELKSQTMVRLSSIQLGKVRGGTYIELDTEDVSGCDWMGGQGSVRSAGCDSP